MITEDDLRLPEYRDVKLEELERRADGKIVRRDRWERGINSIACIFGVSRSYEIDDLVSMVQELHNMKEDLAESWDVANKAAAEDIWHGIKMYGRPL